MAVSACPEAWEDAENMWAPNHYCNLTKNHVGRHLCKCGDWQFTAAELKILETPGRSAATEELFRTLTPKDNTDG